MPGSASPARPSPPSGLSPWTAALYLLERAGTWETLRAWLVEDGIWNRLGFEERQDLGLAWENRTARNLDDSDLIQDLIHWASGHGRRDHPRGFQAPRPSVLFREAGRRGWFTRELGQSRFLINPPGHTPLVLDDVL